MLQQTGSSHFKTGTRLLLSNLFKHGFMRLIFATHRSSRSQQETTKEDWTAGQYKTFVPHDICIKCQGLPFCSPDSFFNQSWACLRIFCVAIWLVKFSWEENVKIVIAQCAAFMTMDESSSHCLSNATAFISLDTNVKPHVLLTKVVLKLIIFSLIEDYFPEQLESYLCPSIILTEFERILTVLDRDR